MYNRWSPYNLIEKRYYQEIYLVFHHCVPPAKASSKNRGAAEVGHGKRSSSELRVDCAVGDDDFRDRVQLNSRRQTGEEAAPLSPFRASSAPENHPRTRRQDMCDGRTLTHPSPSGIPDI